MKRNFVVPAVTLLLTTLTKAQDVGSVQYSWITPAAPDFTSTLTIGDLYNISWESDLIDSFATYAPSADVSSVDLWITDYNLHIYSQLIAGKSLKLQSLALAKYALSPNQLEKISILSRHSPGEWISPQMNSWLPLNGSSDGYLKVSIILRPLSKFPAQASRCRTSLKLLPRQLAARLLQRSPLHPTLLHQPPIPPHPVRCRLRRPLLRTLVEQPLHPIAQQYLTACLQEQRPALPSGSSLAQHCCLGSGGFWHVRWGRNRRMKQDTSTT